MRNNKKSIAGVLIDSKLFRQGVLSEGKLVSTTVKK